MYVYVGQRTISFYKYIIKYMLKYEVQWDEDVNNVFFNAWVQWECVTQYVGYVG